MRKELDESGKLSQSMMDWTTSEQFEDICESRTNGIDLHAINRMEKSPDQVTLSLDRSESQVTRLLQQILDLEETANALQEAEEFKDPEPAI